MRQITDHKVNGLNEALDITVLDEPGSGGANHDYAITLMAASTAPSGSSPCGEVTIRFQNGPILEAGVNGISNEALLVIVADRLIGFQSGPFACEANKVALGHVWDALATLKSRTVERTERGVEGTLQK